jgi:RND family efflux transporter MFP subunit
MTMKWGAILLAAAASLSIAGCRDEAPRVAEVRPVRVMTVEPKPIDDDRQAVGEIRARHESDLAFRVAGKVISRLADIGATVKKDDVLARLDDQDDRSKLQSTEADIASADAVLVEAQGSENRSRQLLASGTTTQANYDSALRNLRSSEAKLTSARAARDLARDQLAYTELHADFDGVVTATGAEPGQVVNIGQMIVRLARPEAKDAVFNIAEAAFKDRPKEEELGISVWLLANPGVTADGVVRNLAGRRRGDAHLSGQGDSEVAARADAPGRQRCRAARPLPRPSPYASQRCSISGDK